MNDVQQEKCVWVNSYLSATLANANLDVRRVRYSVDGAEERVTVIFDNGYTKRVNVTGYSMKAIMADVLKVV
jgi:hypothetical protein